MRMIRFALLAGLLSASTAAIWADDSATGSETPDGRWIVAHRYYTPSKTTDAVGKLLTDLGREVEIKNGKLSASDPTKAGLYFLVDFLSNTTPKSVNLKVPGKRETLLLGIYRVEGDVMSLAIGAGNKRPETFTKPQEQVMLVLKRAPKKPT